MSWKLGLVTVLIFTTGGITGYFVDRLWSLDHQEIGQDESKQIRQVGDYRFINPLLECEISEGSIDVRKINFRSDLERYIEQVKTKYQLTELAVYFRDLNNGPAFGVDETGEFFPASLLKVPILMAYYRWAEDDHELLQREILYENPVDFGVSVVIIPKIDLIAGQKYTVEQLLKQMIVYSDNQATHLLVQRLPVERIENLFRVIGVGNDVTRDGLAKITVKEYAAFFRILFNSSYLSRENSEKALELLSRTDYHDALPGKLPQGIVVAHKFGEAGTGENERQLHDCGIVYFPDHPYLACVMTRGKKTDGLKESIQDVSRFIYDKIDEQY